MALARTTCILVVGAFGVSACDPTASYRKPELNSCESFLQSRMRVPTSYRRQAYEILDFPVTRAMLGQASGHPDRARTAANPVIRRVMVQYEGNDGFGQDATGAGVCLFPLADTADDSYAGDIQATVGRAMHDNEQRALAISLGQQDVPAGDCCTAPSFDVKQLETIKPQPRNSVTPFLRKL